MITTTEIEAIERATMVAVAPQRVAEIEDWLVGLDPGSIRRAASAVPLRHQLAADAVDQIESVFRTHNLPPVFRLADQVGLGAVAKTLASRGYISEQPTLVMTADVSDVIAVSDALPAEVKARPDAAWASVFLGDGFDPIDGAYRVKALSRSPNARFGRVVVEERTVAVGCGSYSHGWASIHGMRTEMAQRGKGHAARVLVGLSIEARAQGLDRVFLQVEEKNTSAQALYRRAAFETAWRYSYWSQRA